MVASLLVGTLLICVTVLVHILGLMVLNWGAKNLTAWLGLEGRLRRIAAMVGIVIGLFALITVEIWLWAIAFAISGAVPDFATALYLSTVTFATVGYGDIVPAADWRLLGALEGVTGFLVIGWSTAYLVVAGTRFGPFRSGEHF